MEQAQKAEMALKVPGLASLGGIPATAEHTAHPPAPSRDKNGKTQLMGQGNLGEALESCRN